MEGMNRGMTVGVVIVNRGLTAKPCLCSRSTGSGTAETRRAQRKQRGREHSNWPSFSDEYSGCWNGSVSAAFAPLRFIGAWFNCRVTAKRSHAAAGLPALLLLCFWAALGSPLSGAAATGPVARDFTFFLLSDVHVGAKNGQGLQPTACGRDGDRRTGQPGYYARAGRAAVSGAAGVRGVEPGRHCRAARVVHPGRPDRWAQGTRRATGTMEGL